MRAACAACIAFSLALAACADEVVPTTQIVIVADADDALRLEATRLELTVYRLDDTSSTEFIEIVGDTQLPLSFSVVPGPDRAMGRLAMTLWGHDEIIARQDLRFAFAPRRTLGYGVLFAKSCESTLCDPGENCGGCGCTPIDLEYEDFTPLRHAEDVFDVWLPRFMSCEPEPEDESDDGT